MDKADFRTVLLVGDFGSGKRSIVEGYVNKLKKNVRTDQVIEIDFDDILQKTHSNGDFSQIINDIFYVATHNETFEITLVLNNIGHLLNLNCYGNTGFSFVNTLIGAIEEDNLKIIAYVVDGAIIHNDNEIGNILDMNDVREISDQCLIINSADVFTKREDVIKFDEIMSLEFNLIGLKVVDQKGKKLGKVVDYTVDSGSFIIYQLIVQRPITSSFFDPQLTINRSQIVEIDDEKITIKHDKQKVRLPKANSKKDFVPNYVNPFRKPNYSEEDKAESSSSTSE
jgi:sporulation protein YlmC with PRC-barrel domain